MSLDLIKAIREKTGLPLKDIKKVVESMPGTGEEVIIEELRKQGLMKKDNRSDRITGQGRVFAYVHEGRIGVMLEVKCETDFVARSSDFVQFGEDLALHIAAYQPLYISPDQAPQDFVEKEIEIAKAQLKEEGKPENIVEKILEGKKKKITEENALVSQQFLKEPSKTIEDKIAEVSQATGEKIEITRFTIYQLS